jgi:hypothetical protein
VQSFETYATITSEETSANRKPKTAEAEDVIMNNNTTETFIAS